MTTKDIRQQALDRMNGTMPPADDERYGIIPMTFNEAVRTAQGYREELGLSGGLIVTVQHYSDAMGYASLEWRAFYSDAKKQEQVVAKSAPALLKLLRATLESYAHPADSLASVGAPSLDCEKVS